jgi:branched-chain amino acid transport system substrate-binding protein
LDGAIVPLTTVYDPSSEEGRLYRAVLAEYAPDTEPTSNYALGYTTVLGFFGAIGELSGEVTAAAVDEAMRASAGVPLPMSGGSTYTCDGKAIPLLPSVCSANVQVATVDADGAPGSPTTIDITGMIAL